MTNDTENTNDSEKQLTHSEQSNQPLVCDNDDNPKIQYTNSAARQSNVSFTLPEKVTSTIYCSTKDSLTQLKSIKTNCVKSRTVLWWLVFIGFAINYMIRINVNITIVDMVMQKKVVNGNSTTKLVRGICLNADTAMSVSSYGNASNLLTEGGRETCSLERKLLQILNLNQHTDGFEWNEKQQGMLLGSFYWLHWVMQIPGGILARKYGTKLVFGLSNVIGCLMCSIMPIVSFLDYRLLIFVRVLQGFICGLAWPAMHNMTAQWIPPHERSKFVTAYLGSSVGIAVFYPIFGAVISLSSWEYVFHLCSILGVIWYVGWLYFVFDSPEKHPRIDPDEKEYILQSLQGSFQNRKKHSVPWKRILTSCPVWMIVISQFGGIWALFTLMVQAPTYFKVIHGWDIKMIGLLSGIPHLMRMFFAFFFSMFGDWLLRTDKMSATSVRKLATFVCSILKGVFVIGIAYSGCNSTSAVVFLTIATALHGAVSTGALASMVDIGPNFSGVILGISGMVGILPGFISPFVVGYLTFGNQTIEQWKYVFMISAGLLIVTGTLFVLFSDSKEQYWNKLADDDDDDGDDGYNKPTIQYSKVPLNEAPANEIRMESSQLKTLKREKWET
ncbi:sialin [Bradysia coprophila]|uniref:sialin n=1 Tax=Bradysia coprophila TaxID=38358 RepID=UPI00187D7620|nr:sialin [Bradysia coprophila]